MPPPARCTCAAPQDKTPLHLAAMNGHLEVVMALLERGADVDPKDVSFFFFGGGGHSSGCLESLRMVETRLLRGRRNEKGDV